MAHIRQARLNCGPGFQVKVLKSFQVAPSSLGRSGREVGSLSRVLAVPESNLAHPKIVLLLFRIGPGLKYNKVEPSVTEATRLGMRFEPLLGSTALHRVDVSWNTSSELSLGKLPGGNAGHLFGLKQFYSR